MVAVVEIAGSTGSGSMPSRLPSWHPSAKQESVGYAMSAPERMLSATWPMVRGWGLSGCTSKYFAIRRAYAVDAGNRRMQGTASGGVRRPAGHRTVRVAAPYAPYTGGVAPYESGGTTADVPLPEAPLRWP